MPDDNRFAGLSEAVDEDDGADEDGVTDDDGEIDDREGGTPEAEDQSAAASGVADDSDADSSSSTEHEFTSKADSDTESDSATGSNSAKSDSSESNSGESVATDSSTRDDSSKTDDPTAFPFDATKKKTVYVRPETLDELEDARALVDAQLRTQHDVRDLTGREFYDAAFRLAAADTDGLIEEVLAAREE